MKKDVLLQFDDWAAAARDLIQRSDDYGVDVGALFLGYQDSVSVFHAWFVEAMTSVFGPDLTDYRRCHRVIERLRAKLGWKTILSPRSDTDPLSEFGAS